MNIKSKLKRLAILEGFNSIFFIVVYFIIIKILDTQFTLVVFYPLLCCSIILLQATVYWTICLKRIDTKSSCICSFRIKYVYRFFRLLNFVLLLMYVLVFFLSQKTIVESFIGLGIFVFAVIEHINYFYIRLSYPIVELIVRLKKRMLAKSRIAKEIDD